VVTMKNAVFSDVTPCGSCKNRCFGGTYRLHHQGDKNQKDKNNVSCKGQPQLHSVLRLLVTANFVPSSPTTVTLTMEVIRSYETSVLTRAT
jgi:hypothetical protein